MNSLSRLYSLFIATLFSLWGCAICSGQFEDASDRLGFSGGGKAAFGDFDDDGFVDLFAGKLWRNVEGKKLVEVPDAGIAGGEGIWGDFDNDGKLDLFVFSGTGALYRNLGDRKFAKVDFPNLPTVNSRGAVWFDLNNDGLLDLYVGGYEIWQKAVHPDVVYLNQGKGKFKEHWRSPENFSARGVCAADFDEDGFVDVYVSNYRLQPNFLWRNNHKGGLEDQGEALGVRGNADQVINYTGGIRYPICGHTIGSCFGDLDNDGHLDLFVGNFSHPRPGQDHPQFLRYRRNKAFENQSEKARLKWQESYASPTLGDFDNDGHLDLFFTTVYAVGSGNLRNYPVLYRGKGQWRFEDNTEQSQLAKLPPTYQAAWADIDNDGDLDLCTAGKLFVNQTTSSNKWIKLELIGDGEHVARTPIGAIARVKIGDQVLSRHVASGTGEGNQNSLILHFGLGDCKSSAVDVEVTWPGKRLQVVKKIKINTLHSIKFEAR